MPLCICPLLEESFTLLLPWVFTSLLQVDHPLPLWEKIQEKLFRRFIMKKALLLSILITLTLGCSLPDIVYEATLLQTRIRIPLPLPKTKSSIHLRLIRSRLIRFTLMISQVLKVAGIFKVQKTLMQIISTTHFISLCIPLTMTCGLIQISTTAMMHK